MSWYLASFLLTLTPVFCEGLFFIEILWYYVVGVNNNMDKKIRKSAKVDRNSAIMRAVDVYGCSFNMLGTITDMNAKTIAEIYYRERARGGFSVPNWVKEKYPNMDLSTA